MGLSAAALAALPALFRFQPSLRLQGFLVCFAGAALVMAPLSAALTRANTSSRFRPALTVGVLVAALPLLPFAALLKATTHHRALGGVTFAIAAGLTIAFGTVLAGQLIGVATRRASPWAKPARLALVALAALGTAALLTGLVHALQVPGSGAYRTGFFDALRVLGLATLAARIPLGRRLSSPQRRLGLAAWIAVVTVGVCLGRAPAMQAELALVAPVLHWPLVWLGG